MTVINVPVSDTELEAQIELEAHIKSLDRHGFLFGKKLTKSMSPLLHDVVYRNLGLKWEQIRLDSTDMARFLKLIQDPKFYGASVTMPHKVAIMQHLDELTPECRAVGACNTIYVRERDDGSRIFCGTNTDVIGVRESFLKNVSDGANVWEGRPAMVVGSGGAARSAVYALREWLGVTEIYLVNRDDSEVEAVMTECTDRGYGPGLLHVRTVEQARQLEGPGAVVACVPDFPPTTYSEKLARDITLTLLDRPHKGAMLEMCYNPSPYTELGALAQGLGWNVILGTEALIYQGIEQDKYWTRLPEEQLPVRQVKETIAEKLAQVSCL